MLELPDVDCAYSSEYAVPHIKIPLLIIIDIELRPRSDRTLYPSRGRIPC